MELIPLIADTLLYLIGLLVLIIIFTVVSKKLRKKPEEEPDKKDIPEVPKSVDPISKPQPKPDLEPKKENSEKPRVNFLDQNPVENKPAKKQDFLSAGANEPKNITIKPKEGTDDLFKMKEEKSNARRYKPRQGKDPRNSQPRFQILNDDIITDKSEGNNNGKGEESNDNDKNGS